MKPIPCRAQNFHDFENQDYSDQPASDKPVDPDRHYLVNDLRFVDDIAK